MTDPSPDRRRQHLAAVLFADIVGYSSLSARDHEAALRLVGALQSSARVSAQEHEGRIVKFLGDGALLEFASSAMAVRAARAMAGGFAEAPTTGSPPQLRIGVHVGEVTAAEDGDLYGDGVNIAARLQQAADPGAVWVSEDVWRQLRSHQEFRFVPCGSQELKGQSGPLGAYRLEPDQKAASAPEKRPGGQRVVESLAVLPFVNMSADPEQEYFSDGIAEELLDAFAKIGSLQVAARTSSFQFKGQSPDVREVGRKLGVTAVLEGSVRKAGNRVRITAQLISSEDGFHLWSDRYDRELDDVFAVQEEIAQSIVGALKVQLPGHSRKLVRQGTEDVEAYGNYLRGRHALDRAGDEAGVRLALELFEKAIARDPEFASAYSGVAECWFKLLNEDFVPPGEALPAARRAVEQALSLDDSLSEAHLSLGQLLREEYDWIGTEREIEKAIELKPSTARGRERLSMLRLTLGRMNETVELLREAEVLDPLSVRTSSNLAFAYAALADYENARKQSLRTLELAPSLGHAHGVLAVALAELGERDSALEHMRKAIELSPDQPSHVSDLAYIHAATGDRESALRYLAEARNAGVRPGLLAQAWIRLGEAEEALKCLDEIDTMPSTFYASLRIPEFQPVHGDPRFRRVFERVGLSPDFSN